jgi:hypothetical protein
MSRTKLQKKDILDAALTAINAEEKGYSVIIPHVIDNQNLFAGSFSHYIDKKYPSVKINYNLLGKSFLLKNPGHVQFNDVDRESSYNRRLIIATMIAQNGTKNKNNPRPLNYAYLVKSMVQVKKFILQNFNSENKVMIYAPKFGTGHSGGNWRFIEDLMKDTWKDIDVVIYP